MKRNHLRATRASMLLLCLALIVTSLPVYAELRVIPQQEICYLPGASLAIELPEGAEYSPPMQESIFNMVQLTIPSSPNTSFTFFSIDMPDADRMAFSTLSDEELRSYFSYLMFESEKADYEVLPDLLPDREALRVFHNNGVYDMEHLLVGYGDYLLNLMIMQHSDYGALSTLSTTTQQSIMRNTLAVAEEPQHSNQFALETCGIVLGVPQGASISQLEDQPTYQAAYIAHPDHPDIIVMLTAKHDPAFAGKTITSPTLTMEALQNAMTNDSTTGYDADTVDVIADFYEGTPALTFETPMPKVAGQHLLALRDGWAIVVSALFTKTPADDSTDMEWAMQVQHEAMRHALGAPIAPIRSDKMAIDDFIAADGRLCIPLHDSEALMVTLPEGYDPFIPPDADAPLIMFTSDEADSFYAIYWRDDVFERGEDLATLVEQPASVDKLKSLFGDQTQDPNGIDFSSDAFVMYLGQPAIYQMNDTKDWENYIFVVDGVLFQINLLTAAPSLSEAESKTLHTLFSIEPLNDQDDVSTSNDRVTIRRVDQK